MIPAAPGGVRGQEGVCVQEGDRGWAGKGVLKKPSMIGGTRPNLPTMFFDPRTGTQPIHRAVVDAVARGGQERTFVTEGGLPWAVVGAGVAPDDLARLGVDRTMSAAARCGGCGTERVQWLGWSLQGWLFRGEEGDVELRCLACKLHTAWGWDATTPGLVPVALACIALLGGCFDLERATRSVHHSSRQTLRFGEDWEVMERTRIWTDDKHRLTRHLVFETNHPSNEMQWSPSLDLSFTVEGLPGGVTLSQRHHLLDSFAVSGGDEQAQRRAEEAWIQAIEQRRTGPG